MTTSAITPMLLHILSFVLGFVVFFLISNRAKPQKITLIKEVFSQTINFVLFIWLSKILLNLPLLFRDPLAMLAYPSSSKAFYLAVLFSVAVILLGTYKGRIEGGPFIGALWHILLSAAFFYEFAQWTWIGNPYAFGNLVLYAVLLVIWLGIEGRLQICGASSVLVAGWALGMLMGSAFQSYPSAFGYTMEPWFILLFFVTSQFFIFFSYKRRSTHECY